MDIATILQTVLAGLLAIFAPAWAARVAGRGRLFVVAGSVCPAEPGSCLAGLAQDCRRARDAALHPPDRPSCLRDLALRHRPPDAGRFSALARIPAARMTIDQVSHQLGRV